MNLGFVLGIMSLILIFLMIKSHRPLEKAMEKKIKGWFTKKSKKKKHSLVYYFFIALLWLLTFLGLIQCSNTFLGFINKGIHLDLGISWVGNYLPPWGIVILGILCFILTVILGNLFKKLTTK